ncbi:MAG: FAD-binding oxidoreductase [Gemmatimonadetes bacterium]|nr:FAD-binding oxidoreductase [Gemmatimonadota bacterium]
MDRRRFLELTGAGAGAVVAGVASPSDARAEGPETPEASPRRAPFVRVGQAPDVCVIGAGAFGLWSALELQRLGATVEVVDLYGPGNSRATSGGETRGVRTSYGDRPHGPQWGRWANEAIRRWKAWDEEHSGREVAPFFYTTGDLILRAEMQPYLERTMALWDDLGVEYEQPSMDVVAREFPQIRSDDMTVALYEPQAGVVRARRVMESVATVFQREGGTVTIGRAAPGRVDAGRLTEVTVEGGDPISAGTYQWACGPWLAKVLPNPMEGRLRIPMGHVFYFGTPPGSNAFNWPNFPSYGVPGCTGWPALPPDHRGFRVRTGGRPPEDPDVSQRGVIPEEGLQRGIDFVKERFPLLADAPILETRACHYESGPSRNFVVDVHPEWENAWITGCGSAEAFKQGPVLGDYIAHRIMGQDLEPELAEGFRLPEETFESDEG